MGGVDKSDQMRAYYTTDRATTRKWTTKVFYFAMDVACVNVYILAKVFRGDGLSSRRKSGGSFVVDRQSFQRRIGLGLIAAGKGLDVDAFLSQWKARAQPTSSQTGGCFPEVIDGATRRRCAMCPDGQSKVTCGKCDVVLCVREGTDCFKRHVEGE